MNSDFEALLKRSVPQAEKKVPKDLFQVAVFYSRPVYEEVKLNTDKLSWLQKRAYKKIAPHLKDMMENQFFVFPFYSENIFMSPKEAENSIPEFIKSLIADGRIPKEAIENGKLSQAIEAAIVPLNFATLERIEEINIG